MSILSSLQDLYRDSSPMQIKVFLADSSVHSFQGELLSNAYQITSNPCEADAIVIPNNDEKWLALSETYDVPVVWQNQLPDNPEFTYLEPSENDLIAIGRDLLEALGEPKRSGTANTPKRFAKAWKFWVSGHRADLSNVLTTFEDGADGCDEMVVVKDIWFYSHCEHHLAPFFGTVSIGYLPQDKIVGLSKLARLTDIFARRLQVQERMTNQVADALMEHLSPLGCGVRITARHLCMESRGIQKPGCETVTSALRGKFRQDPTVRAEFLELVR